jgi:hypothetical protein
MSEKSHERKSKAVRPETTLPLKNRRHASQRRNSALRQIGSFDELFFTGELSARTFVVAVFVHATAFSGYGVVAEAE